MEALEAAGDGLLARRAADGDERAFAVIVRRHAPFLRAYAIRLTGSVADADDAVQEGLVTAWQRLDRLDDPERLRSWLLTIVSRKATDRLRSRKPSEELDERTPAPAGTDPAARAEAASELDGLRAALAELPAEQREVWVLREVGGLPYEEIAERTDSSVSTVRGRLARARATLLERLEAWR